jgi:ABC-type polar amino acid transport system ATPase subunit
VPAFLFLTYFLAGSVITFVPRKSTLIRRVNGLEMYQNGSLRVDGRILCFSTNRLPPSIRK